MIEPIRCSHWDEGTKEIICAEKINEIIDHLNAEKALPFEECKECIEVSKAIGRKVAEKAENKALYKTCEATQDGTLKKEIEKAERCPDKVKVRCDNCGYKGNVEIEKGHSVDSKHCPKCDVTRLERMGS